MSTTLGLAIVTFFALAVTANLGIERVAQLDDRLALNTVTLVGERIEVAIYSVDAVDRKTSVQLKLRDKYNLSDEDSGKLIYRYDSYLPSHDNITRVSIDPPNNNYQIREGRSEYICLRKSSSNGLIIVYPREC